MVKYKKNYLNHSVLIIKVGAITMWISDLMTRHVISCSPQSGIEEAVKLMEKWDTGCLLILENEKLVGIITDRDIAIRIIGKGINPKKCIVKDFMTKNVIMGIPLTDPLAAAKLMNKYQVRRLPVVDGKKLVGIISIADISSYAETILGEVAKSRKR